MTYFLSMYFAVFWMVVLLSNRNELERKKLGKLPLVTILIPAFNEEKSIAKTILSVLKLDYNKEKLDIIVVNDGSTDKTKEIVEDIIKKNPDFNISLINQKNGGKGSALNRGLEIAKGKYFICLDADSFIEKKGLKRLLSYFTSDEIAVVLPMLKVKKPKNMLQKVQWYEYILNMFYKELMGKLNCVHVAPGPFSVYRTDVLREVGGFDANHNLTEDLEMALRLQSKNYVLVQTLDTEVETISPSNLKDLYAQRNRWYKGALINAFKYKKMFLNKKYGDFGMMQMPTIFLSAILALVMIISILYYTFEPYFRYIYHLSFVDFDIITMIKNFIPSYHIFDFNYMTLFVALCMLAVTFFIFRKSHIKTKEKIFKFGSIPVIVYIFFYFLLLGVMWIGIVFDLVLRRRQRW